MNRLNCIHCRDEMILWDMDKYGNVISEPCPFCNKNNKKVLNATNEIERKNKTCLNSPKIVSNEF